MGEIITFYSYKGGTGRTMALANTACLLAEQTRGKVLVIDWDLEAPGLFSYFEDFCAPECTSAEGLVEYMLEIIDILENSNTKNFNDLFYKIEKYLIRPQIKDIDNLFLLNYVFYSICKLFVQSI